MVEVRRETPLAKRIIAAVQTAGETLLPETMSKMFPEATVTDFDEAGRQLEQEFSSLSEAFERRWGIDQAAFTTQGHLIFPEDWEGVYGNLVRRKILTSPLIRDILGYTDETGEEEIPTMSLDEFVDRIRETALADFDVSPEMQSEAEAVQRVWEQYTLILEVIDAFQKE